MDINSLLSRGEESRRANAGSTYAQQPQFQPPTSMGNMNNMNNNNNNNSSSQHSPTSPTRSRYEQQHQQHQHQQQQQHQHQHQQHQPPPTSSSHRSVASPPHYNRSIPPSLPPNAINHAQFAPVGPSSASPLGPNRIANSAHSTPGGDYRSALASSQSTMSPHQHLLRTSSDRPDYALDSASSTHHSVHGHLQKQPHPPSHNSRGIRTSISHEVLRSPSVSKPPISRNNSIVPPTLDIATTDSPTLKPRNFTAKSISKADLQTISDLTKQLAENSYLYDAHQQLIKLLHQGFLSHVFPHDSTGPFQDPNTYPLLSDMRQARQAMDSRVPVGEQLWIDWIQDEIMLARTTDDRVAVMELCQKAVQDEAGSAKLWRIYGDWMWLLYKITHNLPGGYDSNSLEQHSQLGPILKSQSWSQDDKIVGAEVFGWNPMLDVWIHGVKATEWHMDESNTVWDPYVEILLHDLSRHPSPEKVKHVWTFYAERLQKPHATWEQTFAGFSQFVTANYDNSIYEDTMIAANKQSARSKHEYELRQDFENQLRRTMDAQDTTAEISVMTEYLEWEATQVKRKTASPFSLDLNIALLERANLRFPTVADWWEDHVDLITENSDSGRDLLPLLHRATRHCPWSGNLWSKYIYALEAAARPFDELEDVKHRSTSTGLLEELGGMEELIKVYNAWCGYLRRRAFKPNAGEDERDVAEMGIRSVIENVKDIGARKYGNEFKGDPLFRAERIYLRFLAQVGRLEEARETWNKLTATHGDLYEFWDRYYHWEMAVWTKDPNADNGGPLNASPVHATRVLQQGIRRPYLDFPEKLLDFYIHHCSQHETIKRLQETLAEVRRVGKQVSKRREKEAADAAMTQSIAEQQVQTAADVTGQVDDSQHGKRKREEDGKALSPSKRPKADKGGEEQVPVDASSSVTSQVKRDRENTTIIVKHLPAEATEKRVRQFFHDCGDILSLQMTTDDNGEEQTAMLEFETREDVLAAQTKSMKSFDGNSIDVQVGTGTTLWVTNYPPEADESFLRDLFKDCGEIVGIRFPSLKYNTHRRFCYIQFLTPAGALAAASLDGKKFPGNLTLSAKISDPLARKDRTGAMHEGREVFVGNVHYSATESEIQALFDKFGTIQSVRIPRNMAGKSKAMAFVVFTAKEEAEAALEKNLKEFKNRLLKVAISIPNAQGAKRSATTIINAASPGSPNRPDDDDAASSPKSSSAATDNATKDYKERSIILANIPDTVNDARVRVLMEQFGSLRKVSLRPEKNEAVVEFEEVNSVGKAEMGIQGHELGPDVKIELRALGERGVSGRAETKRNGFANTARPIHRPGQIGGGKRGGRGGLGFKKAGSTASLEKNAKSKEEGDNADKGADVEMTNGFGGEQHEGAQQQEQDDAGAEAGGKSNDDFRAMLQQK